MLNSLYIGATGMQAQQNNIDAISNNLANVNTTGYKRSRVDFSDLLYHAVTSSGSGDPTAGVGRLGMGVAMAGNSKTFTAGDMKQTSQPLDMAINGQGFLEVLMPDGSTSYTRSGALQLNQDGRLVTQDGYPLAQSIIVPPDATKVRIDPNGQVFATLAAHKLPVELGQISLANFTNPAGLTAMGNNLYVATERSGDPMMGNPGENGSGTIQQGYLEGSNVQLVDEMVSLIIAQRAYDINAKVVQASDQLLSISNNLYR
jgi:flagellar basal-body rod protein FlgG